MNLNIERADEIGAMTHGVGAPTPCFFPVGSSGDAIGTIAAAKAASRDCSEQAPCRASAVETNQETGVWGGKSEDERRVIRKLGEPSAVAKEARASEGVRIPPVSGRQPGHTLVHRSSAASHIENEREYL